MELDWEKHRRKKTPDFHETTIFKNKMNEANKNGINVVKELSDDNSHMVDNIQARYVLQNVIGESENPNIKVLSSDHNLFIHNKKTGYGFFVHFD